MHAVDATGTDLVQRHVGVQGLYWQHSIARYFSTMQSSPFVHGRRACITSDGVGVLSVQERLDYLAAAPGRAAWWYYPRDIRWDDFHTHPSEEYEEDILFAHFVAAATPPSYVASIADMWSDGTWPLSALSGVYYHPRPAVAEL